MRNSAKKLKKKQKPIIEWIKVEKRKKVKIQLGYKKNGKQNMVKEWRR